MLGSIKRYNEEIAKIKSHISVLPLLTSKFNTVRALYTLALRLNENIVVFKNTSPNAYNKVAEPFKVQMEATCRELVSYISEVRNVETKQALIKSLDDISIRVIVPVQGILAIAPEFNRRFNVYADRYDTDYLGSNEIRDTFEAAYSHIVTGRQQLNVLSSLPMHINVTNAHVEDILRSAEHFADRRISPDIYIYAPSAVSYDAITRMAGYKKIVTGDSAEATISTRFDMNVFATSFMYNYYYDHIEDVEENFRKFFAFMNAHTCAGGVEAIGMPRIFLNNYILEYLSGYLDNMHVVSLNSDARFIVVIGNRKSKNSRDIGVVMDIMIEALTTCGEFSVGLTNQQAEKISFRSAYPTAEEIFSSFNSARAFIERMNNGIAKNLALKTEEESRHPLLPFSPGQLGLVLVSGDVDGVIVENEEFAHAIKGSTIRTPETSTEYDPHSNRVTKITHSTTTSVVMLTGDGEFKSLM